MFHPRARARTHALAALLYTEYQQKQYSTCSLTAVLAEFTTENHGSNSCRISTHSSQLLARQSLAHDVRTGLWGRRDVSGGSRGGASWRRDQQNTSSWTRQTGVVIDTSDRDRHGHLIVMDTSGRAVVSRTHRHGHVRQGSGQQNSSSRTRRTEIVIDTSDMDRHRCVRQGSSWTRQTRQWSAELIVMDTSDRAVVRGLKQNSSP